MRSAVLCSAVLLPTLALGQLNTLMKAKGKKYFGTATDNPELSDSAYVKELSNTADFGQITPGNGQKWVYTEPSQNSFSFTSGDQITNLAKSNGQLLRCHNLVWYQELPDWVSNGQWTNATLTAAMQNHIKNVVTHYKGQCYAWDVVNEGLNDDGTIRQNIFYNTIGQAYFALAFEAAAAADPSVKLYYNDYNIENPGAKSTAAQQLVSSIKAAGAPIHGVGLESHFIVGETPSKAQQVQNMQAFTALGVEVAVTELDVRFSSLPPTSAGLAQQTADYESTVGACLSVSGCVGVTVWDFDDNYSWIPGTFSGQGDADLFWGNLTAKPAYTGLVSLIGGSSAPTSSSSSPGGSPTPSTTTTSIPITTTTSSSSGSSTGAAHWGQCGGQGWTGPTTCVSPYKCTVSNQYYSQCL